MDIVELHDVKFYVSLGYVIITASILTIIIMQICKVILIKKKIITPNMDSNKKDYILSKLGRITALIIYSTLYLSNEYYLKHTITLNEALFIGLLSGGASTLTIAKGLYTTIRQYQKKKSVFDLLAIAEEKLALLQQQAIEKHSKIILTSKEVK